MYKNLISIVLSVSTIPVQIYYFIVNGDQNMNLQKQVKL